MERGHPRRFLQGRRRRARLGSLLQPPAPISGPTSEGQLGHAAWDLLGGLFAWFLLFWAYVQPSLIPWDPSLSRAPRYIGTDLNPRGQSLSRPCPCPPGAELCCLGARAWLLLPLLCPHLTQSLLSCSRQPPALPCLSHSHSPDPVPSATPASSVLGAGVGPCPCPR